MKHQLTASRVGIGARKGDSRGAGQGGRGGAAKRPRAPFSATTSVRPASVEREVALTSVGDWTHTLVLTGELTHRSAPTLEVEIERLCAEGVTGITLDLRKLSQIDATGVAVIAFRNGLCRRRGYEFALIPRTSLMRRAFEQAGVECLLADDSGAALPRRQPLALVAVGEERGA